jgi:hypothetical protein
MNVFPVDSMDRLHRELREEQARNGAQRADISMLEKRIGELRRELDQERSNSVTQICDLIDQREAALKRRDEWHASSKTYEKLATELEQTNTRLSAELETARKLPAFRSVVDMLPEANALAAENTRLQDGRRAAMEYLSYLFGLSCAECGTDWGAETDDVCTDCREQRARLRLAWNALQLSDATSDNVADCKLPGAP